MFIEKDACPQTGDTILDQLSASLAELVRPEGKVVGVDLDKERQKNDKLKVWQGQILLRCLEGPNKFCQSSAFGPLDTFYQARLNLAHDKMTEFK